MSDDRIDEVGDGGRPPVFYSVTRCPHCGEDDLNHFDFGVFLRSRFLGVTSEGETGCGQIESEGDYNHVILCRNCDHRIFDDQRDNEEQLLEWAIDQGQKTEMLEFRCPICESPSLHEYRTGTELYQEVVAIYPIPGESKSEKQHRIALAPYRHLDYATPPRYRCHKGHELSKDDGSPVETAEDLVEWLIGHSPKYRG